MKKYLVYFSLCLMSLSALAQSSWAPHWTARDGAIAAHTRIATSIGGGVMVLGDSITEGFWWGNLNNCRVINGGYGGIKTSELAARIANPLNTAGPKYVILMVGMNSANTAVRSSEKANFGTDYKVIIDAMLARNEYPLLASITPVDKYAATGFSQADINSFNRKIVALSAQYNLPLINLNYSLMDRNPASATYGYALPGMTISDGVHLTASAYVAVYYAYQSALQSEMVRRGAACVTY